MNENSSNQGQTGIESIRMGGMTINGLPIAESADAKQQWPEVQKTEKENKIESIKAKYPTQTVAWINGSIREAEATINNIQKLINDQQTMIGEYKGHISLCEHRDKEIDKTDDKEIIKSLKKQFPPYDVLKMKQQIIQCNEAIERSNIVIKKEYDSISILRELWRNCTQRDLELKQHGVKCN